MTGFNWSDENGATWGGENGGTWSLGPPSAPEGLTATAAGSDTIELSWLNVGAVDTEAVFGLALR